MNSEFIPSNDNLLVEVQAATPVSTSGLYIPETAQSGLQKAKVLAVGEGKVTANGRIKPIVVKGMYVWYGKAAAVEVEIDGVKRTMVAESNIIGYSW